MISRGDAPRPLGLFEGVGIELEYMIVDAKTLAVSPIADVLLRKDGMVESEVEHGDIAWCNELVAHVIELKTNGPATLSTTVMHDFQRNVADINGRLRRFGARLMPSAMHPTMDPLREAVLWPHEYNDVYEAFDRIFGCAGHGWANLQSTHINLPFANDREFARLHAAIRYVLPIIPALCASSPIVEGEFTDWLDTRIDVYRNNARRIPSVMGLVIPEPVISKREYEEKILGTIYGDMAKHDEDGVLRHEWVNARGAIARFDRNTIEIRVADVQECPRADFAVVAGIIALVRHLAMRDWRRIIALNNVSTKALSRIFFDAARKADQSEIVDETYLAEFGIRKPVTTRELWRHVLEHLCSDDPFLPLWQDTLERILTDGCLGRRIMRWLGDGPSPDRIHTAYESLCTCLENGSVFPPD